jgi:hypothetical protein
MTQTVPFLDLDELRQEGRSPHKTRQKIYKIILSRCHDRIKKTNKRTEYRECYYDIPIFLPGYPVYSISDAKDFLITHLNDNGIVAESVGEARIYVSWKPEDIDQQQFQSKAEKATNRPATHQNFNPIHAEHNSQYQRQPPAPSFRPPSQSFGASQSQSQFQSPSQSFQPPSQLFSQHERKSQYNPLKYDPNPPVYQPPPYHANSMAQTISNTNINPNNRNFRPQRYPRSFPTNQPPTHQALQAQAEHVKPKTHTIFAEKPDIADAFKKPIDQVEPSKYIKARTINIIPEASPIMHQESSSNSHKKGKKGKKDDYEANITMLQYDRKFADMLPVNSKKVAQVYPDLLPQKSPDSGAKYRKGPPPF